MTYFVVEPDVAISLGDDTILDASTHPPRVEHLHVVMEGWFSDGLLEVFPCFVFRAELSEAVAAARLTGVEFSPLKMTESAEFQEQFPDTALPQFVWGKIIGEPNQSDFFLSSDHRLVVSGRALEVLKSFDLSKAQIAPILS
jgi:hypothetical protein